MHDESLQNTGPTSDAMMTCEHSRQQIPMNGESMSFAGATHARLTLEPLEDMSPNQRALRVSSSALLMFFARELWSEKIQPLCEGTHLLPGGSSEAAWNALVTLACPSNYEPVALGLNTKGNECSCWVSYPTPTATDWKGGKARKRGMQANLRDLWKEWTGQTYPPPEVSIAVQGFPIMWTRCVRSATQ